MIARSDVFLIGIGVRTSSQGVDFFLEYLKKTEKTFHLIIQELPESPESFIHLDMVFTIIDRDLYMIFESVILSKHDFQTVRIGIENGAVVLIREEKICFMLYQILVWKAILSSAAERKIPGYRREQWHSGTNFLALGPGQIIGYGRNVYTLEELSKKRFANIRAKDMLKNLVRPDDHSRYIITIDSSELPRGGGGCRCMTMPVRRKSI